MQTTRRDVLSFASVGALGAATMAMNQMAQAHSHGEGAPQASKGGKGPAIEGPYLDLRTGKGNQLAYARIQGDLDPAQQKYFWFKGYVNAVQPGKKIVDLVGAQGFGAIRLLPQPDGSIQRLCREIILYTDLKTGAVLDEWTNPITNERVKAVHVDNDPFNYVIADHFPTPPSFGGLNKDVKPPKIPFILPWYQHGDWLEMEIHIHLAYPSALQPDKWPRESAGPVAQVSEYFAHHVLAADMQNPKLGTVDYRGTWNRVTPWLPWMLMGQAPGLCNYNCFMGTTKNLEQIFDRQVMDYAEKNYAKYFEAPSKWTGEPSLSSLEHYARNQKPAPAKP
jgi:Protein of unknown function (DUF1838)